MFFQSCLYVFVAKKKFQKLVNDSLVFEWLFWFSITFTLNVTINRMTSCLYVNLCKNMQMTHLFFDWLLCFSVNFTLSVTINRMTSCLCVNLCSQNWLVDENCSIILVCVYFIFLYFDWMTNIFYPSISI